MLNLSKTTKRIHLKPCCRRIDQYIWRSILSNSSSSNSINPKDIIHQAVAEPCRHHHRSLSPICSTRLAVWVQLVLRRRAAGRGQNGAKAWSRRLWWVDRHRLIDPASHWAAVARAAAPAQSRRYTRGPVGRHLWARPNQTPLPRGEKTMQHVPSLISGYPVGYRTSVRCCMISKILFFKISQKNFSPLFLFKSRNTLLPFLQ